MPENNYFFGHNDIRNFCSDKEFCKSVKMRAK